MRKTLAIAAIATLMSVGGCSAAPSTAPTSPAASAVASTRDVLATLGLTGLSGKQIVEKLDQDPSPRPLAFKASVRSDRVIVGTTHGEVSVPITGERSFYLSLAPYQTRTHDCFFHSLATCKGELAGTPVRVTVKDQAGMDLVNADATTYANGFVGFWLPKDIKGTVTVTAAGKSGTVPFTTGAEDATCLTTLKLS